MIIFENIELFILSIIVVIMSSLAVILSVRAYLKYSSIEKRYDLFMSGRDAESLEQFFLDLQANIDHLMDDNKKNNRRIHSVSPSQRLIYNKKLIEKNKNNEKKNN